MEQVNMLRAVLVGGALLAGVVALVQGMVVPAVMMLAGVCAHAVLWRHLAREKAHAPLRR